MQNRQPVAAVELAVAGVVCGVVQEAGGGQVVRQGAGGVDGCGACADVWQEALVGYAIAVPAFGQDLAFAPWVQAGQVEHGRA